jgi:acyl-CoA synthetase (AMP-forming)/AMP-acid ligase II
MSQAFINISEAWKACLENRADDLFVKIPPQDGSRVLSYSISSFFRRVQRIANAFSFELGLSRGERVAVLCDDNNDLSLLLHGLWLAGLEVLPAPLSVEETVLKKFVFENNIGTVVYPASAAARVATLIGADSPVKNWLVSGGSYDVSAIPGLKRLEELIISADNRELVAVNGSDPALMYPLFEDSGYKILHFTQSALLGAAMTASQLYPEATEDALAWNSFVPMSFDGILHNLLVPLYSKQPSFISKIENLRKFWSEIQISQITFAILSQEELRTIARQNRSSASFDQDSFIVAVWTRSRLSYELLDTFERQFNVPVYPFYTRVEAGGVLTGHKSPTKRLKSDSDEETVVSPWQREYSIPSVGTVLTNTEMAIIDISGNRLSTEVTGEMLVSTHNAASNIELPFKTGQEGFSIEEGDGSKYFFITGNLLEMIQRGSDTVNLAFIDNVLHNVKGIEFALTVGFSNYFVGQEVGAVVVALSAARLTEQKLLSILQKKLEWFECPKKIIFIKRNEINNFDSRRSAEKRFEDYYHVDFTI